MRTLMDDKQRGHAEHHPRWACTQRVALLDQYRALQAEGVSQRQAAKVRHIPRTTLQAWHVWQERLDACPQVVTFFESGPGLAFLHRLVMALHMVFVEIGACGIRLICRFLEMRALHRFVGASYGTQQQVNRHVEEAMVAYKREETARLAQEMPPQEIAVTQDETFTGGLCLVAMEPVSNDMLLEQVAETRDHDTWHACMEDTLAPLKCTVVQSTSDEAPGLLAYVAQHLGAHHSPDLFHVQQELSKAVSAPMAAKQRAAAKATLKAEERLTRMHAQLANISTEPVNRGPGRPPKVATSLEQAEGEVDAARHEHQRLMEQRKTVRHSIRAIGHAYHFVDLERGVRRNGKLIASAIHNHIATIRRIAQQEGLSQACLERLEKAERVVPKMQATIEFVSTYVRQYVSQLALPQPASYAMHAHLIPSYYLERVAATKLIREGAPLRDLAERIRTSLCAPGGVFGELHPLEQGGLKQKAAKLAEVFQRSSSHVEGRHGYLSLRHHQRRGLDRPRKRACLTAVHNFCLTRPDGTTAAERFFGQKPRSMFTAIFASVEIPPAPLSPPQRAVG